MNSRERIISALNFNEPDKLPVDFGGMPTTGIHVSMVYKLRQRFGLDKSLTPVKVVEPYQMLGEIDNDLKYLLGVDSISITGKNNIFGFENEDWKEWKLWDGTPVLVPRLFNTVPNKNGGIFMYPQGDNNASPSAIMPCKGYYFDSINRQKKIDGINLNVEDNLEEFKIISDNDLSFIKEKVDEYYDKTDFFLTANLAASGFGDIALVPGPSLKDPKGIRDITEWYISTVARKNYVFQIFEKQCEIAIDNYNRIFKAIGNKIGVIFVSGTDFATQTGLFISKELYNSLYKPFHIKVNNWIHKNTKWKTLCHSCGAVEPLISAMIDAEFDILNPVQISANGMDPSYLKKKYGKSIVFWGGGVDTQKTLPFGTPKEVSEEVKRLVNIFNHDGGYVFNTIHNIQANTPIENLEALVNVIQGFRN